MTVYILSHAYQKYKTKICGLWLYTPISLIGLKLRKKESNTALQLDFYRDMWIIMERIYCSVSRVWWLFIGIDDMRNPLKSLEKQETEQKEKENMALAWY